MKILDVSAVLDTKQFFPKEGTLQFLQDAHKETVANTMIALIGNSYNPSTIYVMWGCVNSGSGSNFVISAGAIFFNGEVYSVAATSFSTTTGQTAICNLSVSQYTTNADPVTYSDSTTGNIHNIRQIAIVAGTSGTGTIGDYSTANFLSFHIPAQVNLTGAGVTGAYPNYTIAGANGLNPVLYAGVKSLGDADTGSGGDFAVTFPALSTSSYYVMGTMVSLGTPQTDTAIIWTIRNRTTTGFTVHCREAFSGAQALNFEFILFAM